MTKNGDIVYTEAEADHKVRLLAATIILRVHGQQHDDEQQPGNPHQEADPGTPAEEAQLDPADRVLFEQATKIEAELAKVDRELDDGGHGTDQ